MKLAFSVMLIGLSFHALAKKNPYRIVIISDESAIVRASEFKTYLMSKPPYSKMKPEDLDIKIVKATAKEMDCKNNTKDSERIVRCDDRVLSKIKAREEASLALAFTSQGNGGSGGSIPIASIDYPTPTMLHEMLHVYGMHDEYEYTASEAKMYCSYQRAGNVAHFKDNPPYANDGVARDKHKKQVPWMSLISSATLITQGAALGSKFEKFEKGKQVIGLYKGGIPITLEFSGSEDLKIIS